MSDALGLESRGAAVLHVPRGLSSRSIRSTNIDALLRRIVFVVLLTRAICDPIFALSGTDLGGESLSFGAVVNFIVIAIAFMFLLRRPSTAPFAVYAIWTPFLLAAFGATLYAPQFGAAARLSLVVLSYWAMFALPFFMLRSDADLARLVLLIFASSIVPSIYAVWNILTGSSLFGDFRLQSTFSHPNIFAFYLVLLLGLALFVIASPGRWPRYLRTLIICYVPLLILFLALTKTRSAWAACAVMFLLYAVWLDRRLLLGLLALPLLLLVAPATISDRLSDLNNAVAVESFKELNANTQLNSFAWRKALWESAVPSIVEQPILGHGLQSFRGATPQFFPLVGSAGTDAHNLYLQILFEMGAVGLVAYAWLLGSLVWLLQTGLRYDRKGIAVMLIVTAAYALESFSDNMIYYLAFNWYFVFAVGTIGAWIEYQKRASRFGQAADQQAPRYLTCS